MILAESGALLPVLAAPAPAQTAGEVTVYSARHYGQEAAFDAFTKKTGIQLKIFNGSTSELFERLINVAAAGEFQAAAVRLADRAGYK